MLDANSTVPGLVCSRGSRLGARASAAAPALPPLRLRLPLLRLRSPASFPSLHHLLARNGFRRSPLLRLRVRRVPGGVGVRGGGVGVRGGGVGLRGGGGLTEEGGLTTLAESRVAEDT